MGTTGKLLKGCLLAAGWFLLSSLLLVAIYIAWSMHANKRAEQAASALCRGTQVGERIEAVIAKAAAGDPRPRVAPGDGKYHFIYQGAIFNARECDLATVLGRVTAKRTISHDDEAQSP